MNLLLPLPIIIPMLTGIAAILARHRSPSFQRWLNIIGSFALLITTVWLLVVVERHGIRAVQLGGWPAPYGITLVADLFSAVMLLLTGVIGLTVAVFSLASVDPAHEKLGFHQLYQFLLMGVCGAFLTGDLFNLYVWFEVMLMASFVLLALGGERPQMEGAIKYVTLNLMASALFLAALGLLYGMAGTLNMADLGRIFSEPDSERFVGFNTLLAVLFMVSFGIKAAIFPLFFWLPDSYHTPPVTVSAVFSGLLTKVGVYALVRVFTLIFIQETHITHSLILIIAGVTMITGVLGAVAQYDIRRLLSFHIISQIGYLMMGLGLYTAYGLAATVYFTFHVSVAKTALFFVSGALQSRHGTFDLKKLGGGYHELPVLSLLFLVSALGLAGLPPLSGFFAKLGLVQAGLADGHYVIVGVALGVSILTLFSMIKIWNEAFWKPRKTKEDDSHDKHHPADGRAWNTMLTSIAMLAVLTLILGLGASSAFGLALRAGEQLMNPAMYIDAVLEVGS
jgi:multicomponent Na+:H+ antiporter subunit D